jgi:hypothetical protein
MSQRTVGLSFSGKAVQEEMFDVKSFEFQRLCDSEVKEQYWV